MTRLDIQLPVHVDSPAEARHALGGLTEAVPAALLGDMRLLVSELVTNALRHAGLGPGDHIGLHIDVADSGVRVEVSDTGRGFAPVVPDPDPDRASGWGLYLVQTLSADWGVERADGTTVWFELKA